MAHSLSTHESLPTQRFLKPDRFTAAKVFFEYGKLVAQTAKEFGIGFSDKGGVLKPAIREVLFLYTADGGTARGRRS